MVRTRSAGGCGDGDVDWAKFLYDDVGELVTEEVAVIPKNIVSERRKRLESLLSNRVDSTKEQETCVDSDCGETREAKSRTISPSVDKRHAVLCFDPSADSFSVKDLNTTNGTFLNNRRLSSDRPEKLNNMDLLRFGFGTAASGVENPQNDQNVTYSPASQRRRPNSACGSGNDILGGGGGPSSQSSHVMQQTGVGGGRGNSLYGSRVSSPSLTLDSGRGSSSAPSSPAKDMSPVPGPISTSSNANNSLFYSPNLSRKMTKSSSVEPNQNRLLYSSNRSRNNSQEQTPVAPLLSRDSLEDEINVTDKAVFPSSANNNKDCNKSAVFGDLDDLNVPNEVFDDEQEAREEIMPVIMGATSSVSKTDGTCNSRPHSRCGIAHNSAQESATSANSTNAQAPPTTSTTPTPLYGTPHWWPQNQPEEDDDQFSAVKLSDDTTSNEEGDGHSDCRPTTDTGPLSINSESNLSMDSASDASVSVDKKKKISPMAFTVDFDDGPKKFGISDSISKFAPRHRRNISLTKSEDIASKRNSTCSDTTTPLFPLSKKDSSSLTSNTSHSNSNNNKSVIEGEVNDLKCFSSRFTKGNKVPPTKLVPVSTSDNNKKIFNHEVESSASSSPTKPESESFNKMQDSKLSSGLFSRLTKSSSTERKIDSDNAAATSSGSGWLKNKFDPRKIMLNKTSTKPAGAGDVNKRTEKMDNSAKVTKDADKDVDDASSETGTYTVEKEEPAVARARKSIEKMLRVPISDSEISGSAVEDEDQGATVNSNSEWVREWAEQAANLHKKNKELNPASDTRMLLQETENVVSAMQERVTRHMSNNNSSHNSDSDDEATLSHTSPQKLVNSRFSKRPERPTSLARHIVSSNGPSGPMRDLPPREVSCLSDSGYQVGYQSDSSNDGVREYKNIGAVKMNKAFNIRRGRVIGYDSDGSAIAAMSRQSLAAPTRGVSPRPCGSVCSASGIPPTSPATSSSFSRNDGGRFSLRMPKSRTSTNQMPPPQIPAPSRSTPKAPTSAGAYSSSSGKVDPLGRRRQSQTQTPTSAVPNSNNANFRKPPTGSRSNSTLTSKEVEMANWRRRKSYDPLKAAAEARKKRGTCSAVETTLDDISPTDMSHQSTAFMSRSMSFHSENHFPAKCPSEEEDMIYVVDEIDSSHSNSPIHIPMTQRSSHEDGSYYGMNSHSSSHSHSSMRPKNKLEALDNLVIATIHSLSNKVRTSSRHLLEKLQSQHLDNENGALLEEMVSQLKELELSSCNSSPNKSPSRELSGTLKNLKKLEQVILVLDRVLCDDSGSDANN